MAEAPADTIDGMDGPAPKRTRPANNAAYLAAGNLIAKIFAVVLVVYAMRTLKPSLYGNYNEVIAFVGLLAFLTDLGMSTVAVRDVTADRTLAVRYISNLLVLRLVLSALDIGFIVLLAQAFIATSLRGALYVYALALAPLAVTSTLQLVFQFNERMGINAVVNVVTALVRVALSILALYLGHRVLGLMVIFTAVTTANMLVMIWIVYTRLLPRRLEIDLAWWPSLVWRALPFLWMTVLHMVYTRGDMQILYVMSGCGQARGNAGCVPTGQYGAAYQLLDVLTLIFVTSIGLAAVPTLTRLAGESREALVRVLRSSLVVMLALGVPVAVFASFYAHIAILLAGHNYLPAAPALAIITWAFPCYLVLSLVSAALIALNRQSAIALAFAMSLIFNISLNIVLVPHYSYMASSVLTVASEGVNGLFLFVALHRALGPLRLGSVVLRVALANLALAAVLWFLRPVGILVGIPVGVALVALGIKWTRLFGRVEGEVLGRLPLVGRYAAWLAWPAA